MITRIFAVAAAELHIARRNLWVLMATVIMTLFALALTFAGAAPTGALGVDLLTVSVASMTTLSVYLAPLLALMMSFDAIAGENERGGLALLLTYPVSRGEILLGKFLAHIGTIALAMVIGFGAAGIAAALTGGADAESVTALLRLIGTSVLLGAVFLALGYALSAAVASPTAAAGLAAGLWLIFVVLYDLGLLGAVVYDNDGFFTRQVFPWLLVLNPADAFRLWNVGASENVALANGMTGVASALPVWSAPLSLLLWPIAAFVIARQMFGRVRP
ncbi:ABC transporter permease [Hoeflea sp.]|uniref:ABC transporter permease n=1 Tax=Hoeflea sp. TaxID=1940281 RepID=UPI003B013B70